MIGKLSAQMHTHEGEEQPQAAWHGEMNLPGSQGQVYDPFPASVRATDTSGQAFLVKTIIDSLSPRWLCLRLAREMREGMRLFAIIHLSDEKTEVVPPLRVAIRGIAVKVERRPSQAYSVTVRVTSYRLLAQ